jgi:hypothetical protein
MGRKYIRIIAVPPGEAPEEIRRAWVGVRLPLLLWHGKKREWRSAGVLTGPKSLFARLSALFSGALQRQSGYAVVVLDAIAALAVTHPEAARWWRENAPHVVRPGKVFVFAAEACVEEQETTVPGSRSS